MMTKTLKKTAMLTTVGAGLMALPFALPSTAQADDFKIHLNLGGGGYYQPVAYHPPVQRVVYREVRPQKVVYVSRPVYRERVVYRDHRGHPGRGHGHWKHDRWDNDRDHRVAWR